MPSVLDEPQTQSVLSTSPPGTEAAPRMRAFGDPDATRKAIYDNVLEAINKIGPLANSRHTLSVSDVHYSDPEHHSIQKQKEAVLTGKSLYRRIKGTWSLTDNATGKILDKQPMTLAQVPALSHRGTFILNGTEYTISNQMRLRPGIFTRVKENGEIESHVNVMPGGGFSHRYFLDPETGVFKINVGQAKLPLLPVLRAMGVSERELRQHWGNEITAANMQSDDPRVVDKLYARVVRRGNPGADAVEKQKAIADTLTNMKLDPEVTKRTLGSPYATLTKDAILDTTKKLIAVSRKEADPDDRDHMAFQTLHGPEDLLAERLTKDKAFLRQLLWKSSFKGNLSGMQPGALTRQLHATLLHTGLGQAAEEINPAELLDAQGRATRLGEGGIGNIDAVPDESRNVQPSHFAYIDPVRTPESFKVGVDTRLTYAARKGSDGRIYAPFHDVRTGRTVHRAPQDVADLTVAFPGEMRRGRAIVAAMQQGQTRFVPREEVHLELPHMEHAFSPLANMIPLKSALKGQRMSMGSRYLAQALPLVNREAPFLQSGMPSYDPGFDKAAAFDSPAPDLGASALSREPATPGLNTQLPPLNAHALKPIAPTMPTSQAMLKTPFAPTLGVSERSFEDHFGKSMGALHSIGNGVVKKVTPDSIHVRYDDGTVQQHELYNHFPFSRKTFIHNEPVVNVGDKIGHGQLLAKSNYTDHTGATALGLNARIAFVPFRGANYEDAAVISESMAKRLASEHMYQHDQEWHDNIKKGKRAFISLFPSEFERGQLEKMDDHGVVKPGQVIKYGDPLVLVAQERERTHSQIHRGRAPSYANKSLLWEHHSDGIVTDVAHGSGGTTVAVKAVVPMQVGDKISNRYGGKGVVSQIVPDHQMPHDDDGSPYEVALNPLGMISRINPVQIAEMVLGKIAKKTGKAYKVEDFNHIEDLTKFVQDEMQKHGVKDMEDITDPETGRKMNVLTGYQYLLKLHHTSEAKGQGRGVGGYTSEEIPAKGGPEGSKRIALLETNALLSHGATEFLRDAHLIRGQKNDNYWQAFMSGFRPPEPKVPFVYEKFVSNLKGAGINVVRDGGQTHIMALTDKDVDRLVGDRYITNTDTVDWKEGLKPRKGGFFDPSLTGGHGGNRWAAIKLHEPMPNPAFEEPIRRLLGLTQKKFEGVLSGRDSISTGSGPQAIQKALESIDVDKALESARAEVAGSRKGARDEAVRKLQYLKNAQRLGIHPKEWMLTKVPVIPPAFRPVSVMQTTGNQLVSDSNYLYKELFDANENLKQLHGVVDDVSGERTNLYNAFKGVTGLGDPIQPKNQERQVKGLLKQVFGHAPKFGMVQRQLLGSTVEMVGRAVITPNPDLDMDHVGIPENKAWDVYKPFIIRNLVQKGVPRLEAARHVREQSKIARDALINAMEDRPVVISRAPVLHRYGIMAFWPKLVKGDVMQISPLVTKGFNADFDGDTMNYHVPASDEARKDAIDKMLPSRNLFSSSDFGVHQLPGQEYVGGLYSASTMKNEKQRPHVFATKKDAIRAYRDHRIHIDTPVEIVQH